LIRLVLALVITVLGIVVATVVDNCSGAREEHPRYA